MAVAGFALAALALGHALQINNGFYNDTALRWLTASIVFGVLGTIYVRRPASERRAITIPICVALAAGIGWQLYALMIDKPGIYLNDSVNLTPFRAGLAVEACAIACAFVRRPVVGRTWFASVLAIHSALGIWIIKASPKPWIDVVTVHRAAIDALLHHHDPYRVAIENIYGNLATHFYNPAAIVGNQIAIAYPYPPVSLLLAVPGQVLGGDYRYSELAALIAGAALIGFSSRALAGKLAACIFLTTPRGLFVVEQGWTEPIAVLLLAATVYLMGRSRVAAACAGGLLVVAKQYLGLAAPAFARWALGFRRGWPTIFFWAALTGAAATLPFALWHPNAFMNNVVWLQTREPFRIDSLSYLSWAARAGWGTGSFLWAVAGGVVALTIGLAITTNTPAGFAATVALASLTTFALGSKAFCNYYFFVIGAMCCAAAVSAGPGTTENSSTLH